MSGDSHEAEHRVDKETFDVAMTKLFFSAMVMGAAYALLAAGFVTLGAGFFELEHFGVSVALVVGSVGAALLGKYELASSRRHMAEAVEVVE